MLGHYAYFGITGNFYSIDPATLVPRCERHTKCACFGEARLIRAGFHAQFIGILHQSLLLIRNALNESGYLQCL